MDNGLWDYKQQGRQYEDFGNFNFGATGAALGLSNYVLLRGAGIAQIMAGTSAPEWSFWGFSHGDDPEDQLQIRAGINFYFKYGKTR